LATKKELEKRVVVLEEKVEMLARQNYQLIQEITELKKPKEPSYLA